MRIEEVLAEYTPSNWKRRYFRRPPADAGAGGAYVKQALVFDHLDVSAQAGKAGARPEGLMEYLALLTDAAAREKLAAALGREPAGLGEFNLCLEVA